MESQPHNREKDLAKVKVTVSIANDKREEKNIFLSIPNTSLLLKI
jgi:hypothetical protein